MIQVRDLGTLAYRDAWAVQEEAQAEVVAGGEERLLLVEHPPVITFGRRPEQWNHLLASLERLAEMGVELVHSDRGGDITFHGPGQVVAYPIIRLADHALSVGGYVRALEDAGVRAAAEVGIEARREHGQVGIWTDQGKLGAIGVRVRRGVTMHGMALNVETDLRYFELIVPCGIAGRKATSVRRILGPRAPAMESVKRILADAIRGVFARAARPTCTRH